MLGRLPGAVTVAVRDAWPRKEKFAPTERRAPDGVLDLVLGADDDDAQAPGSDVSLR